MKDITAAIIMQWAAAFAAETSDLEWDGSLPLFSGVECAADSPWTAKYLPSKRTMYVCTRGEGRIADTLEHPEMRSTILHEMVHYLQHTNGWPIIYCERKRGENVYDSPWERLAHEMENLYRWAHGLKPRPESAIRVLACELPGDRCQRQDGSTVLCPAQQRRIMQSGAMKSMVGVD